MAVSPPPPGSGGTESQLLDQALQDYQAGRFESSLEDCDRALDCDPLLADAHNLRGVVLEQLGRHEEAVDAYWTALELDRDHHEAALNLRELAVELAEAAPEEAGSVGDEETGSLPGRILASDPAIALAQRHLARAQDAYDQGRFGATLAGCRLALALDPELGEAHNLKGLALEEFGRLGQAAESYRQAFSLDPDLYVALDNYRELEQELVETRHLVAVATFVHPLDAHIARGCLEGGNIASFIADESMVTLNHFWSVAMNGVKLLVTKENTSLALEILSCEPDADERQEREAEMKDLCPACGSRCTGYETYNLGVAYLASALMYMPLLWSKVLFVLLLPVFLVLIPRRAWVCGSCGHIWKAALQPVPQSPDGEAKQTLDQ